jgi:curved DNA-binding protein CbpA
MTCSHAWWKEVMVMAPADHRVPVPDLYRLLGVARESSSRQITQAWRRRALAEHPDRRPHDAAATARFRALAEAYRVLGDPARRAAYDRSLRDHGAPASEDPAAEAPAGQRHSSGVPVAVRSAGRVPEPPLRAGPVRVNIPRPATGPRAAEEDAVRLAALAELAVRYLSGDSDRPW